MAAGADRGVSEGAVARRPPAAEVVPRQALSVIAEDSHVPPSSVRPCGKPLDHLATCVVSVSRWHRLPGVHRPRAVPVSLLLGLPVASWPLRDRHFRHPLLALRVDVELLQMGDLLAPCVPVDPRPAGIKASPVVVGRVIGLGRVPPVLPAPALMQEVQLPAEGRRPVDLTVQRALQEVHPMEVRVQVRVVDEAGRQQVRRAIRNAQVIEPHLPLVRGKLQVPGLRLRLR